MRVVLHGGLSLHCETFGAQGGLPLLFVHGFTLAGEMWRPVVERLDPARFRSIVPDLRGHGRSDVSPEVTIARFADDLAALLDATGERRPVVFIGLSMGGLIAFEFFRRHRDRLGALVFVDCRPNAESPEGVEKREAAARAALAEGSRAIADQVIEIMFAKQAPAPLRERWHEVMSRTPREGAAAAARALATRADSIPTLPTINVPTLIIFGEEDAITPPSIAREMHEAIPNSRLVLIPSAGHMSPVEQPELFTDAIRGFLDSLHAAT